MLIKRQRGFTLYEIILVVILLGFIALITANVINQNIRQSANARELDYLANEISKVTQSLYQEIGGTKNILFNDIPRKNNDLMDVIINGDEFIAERYITSYANSTAYELKNKVASVVRPVPDSKQGDYRLPFNTESKINIIADPEVTSTGVIVQFTNINTEVIKRIKGKYESGSGTNDLDSNGFIGHGDIRQDRATLRYRFDISD